MCSNRMNQKPAINLKHSLCIFCVNSLILCVANDNLLNKLLKTLTGMFLDIQLTVLYTGDCTIGAQ